ncbi:SSI family serine proteinase inhibitor [Klenkia brasiliensis]|uniref:Subtilisin inhibitor-like n=1 Tax=Klenkia brasiliensis TaxID=333142 RepID=A0A1G7QIN4_9ACTN|nr:SSI family serine proteinase inhibitor [Klenkia brasiliensis]SDF98328.1 Subtilisin inhibitor-like [Klenkia brasiliensis]
MRRALLAAGAVLLLAGCGGGDPTSAPATSSGPASSGPTSSSAPGTTTASPGAPAVGGTALTVVVDPDGSGESVVVGTLSCDPTGGDVPDPDAACAQVAAVGPAGFAAPDPGAVCTQQFDGPQTATVSGTVAGQPVDAAFSRSDGCAISRWDALSELLSTTR